MKIGFIIDPIASLKPYKDTTLGIMCAAQRRGWDLCYLEMHAVFARDGVSRAIAYPCTMEEDAPNPYRIGAATEIALADLDLLFMRKDPPVDQAYLYLCQLLEEPARHGCVVVNHPRAIRALNEKLSALNFADLMPPTLVTGDATQIRDFIAGQQHVVVKPLDGMGGSGIFRIAAGDSNLNVILETLFATHRYLMAQRYLPEIAAGDKRILLVDGEVIPYALARIPQGNDHRGNLAVSGKNKVIPLSTRDHQICNRVGEWLKTQQILFSGVDIIGDHLTEINITSPTGMQEIERATRLQIADRLLDRAQAQKSGETNTLF